MSETYKLVIKQVAEDNECILADIWAAMGRADWVIHPDTVHANDLGHQLIGNRACEAIANKCSGIASRNTEDLSEAHKKVHAVMKELKERSNCHPL